MERFYLTSYLEKYAQLPHGLYDALKFDLDKCVMYYGDQFRYPREKDAVREAIFVWRSNLQGWLRIFRRKAGCERGSEKRRIVSNAYFSYNREIEAAGYRVCLPPWIEKWPGGEGSRDLYSRIRRIHLALNRSPFNSLIDSGFIQELEEFRKLLKGFFEHMSCGGLVIPFDITFFENISIQVFREIGRPSFVFLHGLPGRYNGIDDSRADYLVVWGDRIRENYVQVGVPRSKILVSGHPTLRSLPPKTRRFQLDNILVITKSMPGAHPNSDDVILSDRGNSVLYCYSVQNMLRRHGVVRARLRLHPSESVKWYRHFIDNRFFVIDEQPLGKSLQEATLVVGPTSTVMLETFYAGVNYLVYEPSSRGIDALNYRLVPPFDGSEPRLPVAMSEEELDDRLREKREIDLSFLSEYVRPSFDLGFLRNTCG